MVVAAAAVCAGTAAYGKTVSIHFNGFCNGLDITTNSKSAVASSVENGCAAGFGGGIGVLGTINGYTGSQYAIGENYDDGAGKYIGEEFWIISAPLVSGGTYEGWKHKSGGRLKMFGSGTYSVSGAPGSYGGKRLMPHK
jgi:hypothetical protein